MICRRRPSLGLDFGTSAGRIVRYGGRWLGPKDATPPPLAFRSAGPFVCVTPEAVTWSRRLGINAALFLCIGTLFVTEYGFFDAYAGRCSSIADDVAPAAVLPVGGYRAVRLKIDGGVKLDVHVGWGRRHDHCPALSRHAR